MKHLIPSIITVLLLTGCEAEIEATDNRTGDKNEIKITVEQKLDKEVKENDHSLTEMTDEDIEEAKNYKW